MTDWIALSIALGEVALLSLLDLVCFIPIFARIFLLNKIDSLHRNVVSDIPGNPHAFDNAIISLFRTLPEPSNFNIVWTGLNYDAPLLLKGELPSCRYNSLSVYGAESSEPPVSIDLCDEISPKTNTFEVTIAKNVGSADGNTDAKSDNGIVTLHAHPQWKKGFIAMRNYLVPPGTLVNTPVIFNKLTGEIVRPSNTLVAGPCGLDMRGYSKWGRGFVRIVIVNALFALFNLVFFSSFCLTGTNTGNASIDCTETLAADNTCGVATTERGSVIATISTRCLHFLSLLQADAATSSQLLWLLLLILGIHATSFALAGGMYNLCFILGKIRLKKLTQDMCPQSNQFYYASLEQGAKASQPSKLHKYWIMRLDLSSDSSTNRSRNPALRVRFKIDPTWQKYWSMVVYDSYGLPLPRYVYDENAVKHFLDTSTAAAASNSSKGNGSSERVTRSSVATTTSESTTAGTSTTNSGIRSSSSGGSSKQISTAGPSTSPYEVFIDLLNTGPTTSTSTSSSFAGVGSGGGSGTDVCRNPIDVSSAPVGYVLFRINHPSTEDVVSFSTPDVEILR